MANLPTERRLALVVEYEGTNYAGFQLQTTEPTIQGEIEQALFQLTGAQIRVRGASRTDAGAHALGQVVDFATDSQYPVETFVSALNHYLPSDIRIVGGEEVRLDFHSRRDANSRVYRYQIWNREYPPALYRRNCHWVREPLKAHWMDLASKALVGIHDFRPFAPSHPVEQSAVRQVNRWETTVGVEDKGGISITCEANGFMQHQIRRTNAVLVEVGKGKLPPDIIEKILEANQENEKKIPLNSIPTLPSKGLCLVEVKYRIPWSQVERQNETN